MEETDFQVKTELRSQEESASTDRNASLILTATGPSVCVTKDFLRWKSEILSTAFQATQLTADLEMEK